MEFLLRKICCIFVVGIEISSLSRGAGNELNVGYNPTAIDETKIDEYGNK